MQEHEREAGEPQDQDAATDLDDEEIEEAERRTGVRPHLVHEAIRREGELELARPTSGLGWSALGAGLAMGFSFVGEGVLRAHLPSAAAWTPLVSALGYTLGFVFVITARQQLFTEHTLLAIIPLFSQPSWRSFGSVCRLWAVVLVANLAGTLAFAAAVAHLPLFDAPVRDQLAALARQAMDASAGATFVRAIFAGWLIALLVWMLPVAEHARFGLIVLVSYVVGACRFAHIIAGAAETLFAVVRGEAGIGHWLVRWFLPTLAGNIVGGVAIVAALNHAQVVASNGKPGERLH